MEKRQILGLKYYFYNLLLIWLVILFFYFLSNIGYIIKQTFSLILNLALAYTILSPPFYIFFSKKPSKGYIILVAVKKIITNLFYYIKYSANSQYPLKKITKEEKVSILFLLVKLFFIPVMITFCINNYDSLAKFVLSLTGEKIGTDYFIHVIYPLGLSLMFFLDTLFFSFGYLFESGFLKNTVRSVEPTFFGWVVALACYPPFNGFIGRYVPWQAGDYLEYSSTITTTIVRISILLLFGVFVWATFALGTKCSNLTNRGIVSRGPYAFVRHPAYTSKTLCWWISIIPIMNLTAAIGMLIWTIIYFFRAITEERHLIKDPDYQEYCRKVKYRFIPYVF